MHLLLRNCHIISPSQNINGRFDILIVNGVIEKMGVVYQHVREVVEYDLTGKVAVPGFFDMHVHFREPGQTHKEDIKSGSLAAAYGGFTGVLCMPNTNPPIDNTNVLKDDIEKSRESVSGVYFTSCATKGREGNELADLKSMAENGALAFTDDGSPIENDVIMKKVLKKAADLRKPVLQHCEIKSISNSGAINRGKVSDKLKIKGIPAESEYKIIERDIGLVREINNSHYHVQHITTKEAVGLVRNAKRENLNATSEVCPHHFILTENAIFEHGTNAKMNPPLRTEADVAEIREGLKDGTIDVICTDHAPHTQDEKNLPISEAPFGIVGLETAVGLTYTYLVETGIISLDGMINKMSVNPRKILNLSPIKVQEGEKANLTILDLNKKWNVDVNKFHSKSKNTPFNGWELKGKPVGIVNYEKYLIYV